MAGNTGNKNQSQKHHNTVPQDNVTYRVRTANIIANDTMAIDQPIIDLII